MIRGDEVLIVDAGNTWIKVSFASGGVIHPAGRMRTSERAEDLSLESPAPWERTPAVAVVACAAPRAESAVHDWLRSLGVGRIYRVGSDLPVPLALDYKTPETLGQDRLLVAFEAFRRTGGGVVVVDAGTAVTVDVVDRGGVFRGGAIAPGFAALAAGLREAAPGLPPPLRAPAGYPATSSAGCVSAGVAGLLRGGVGFLVEQAAALLVPDAPVWLTGGDADLIAGLLPEIRWQSERQLLESGIYRLWRETREGGVP